MKQNKNESITASEEFKACLNYLQTKYKKLELDVDEVAFELSISKKELYKRITNQSDCPFFIQKKRYDVIKIKIWDLAVYQVSRVSFKTSN